MQLFAFVLENQQLFCSVIFNAAKEAKISIINH